MGRLRMLLMDNAPDPLMYPHAVEMIIAGALRRNRCLLILGEPGSGKSTLAAELGRALVGLGRSAWCIGADPGSPAFGIPGAVCLGEWRDDRWQLREYEALCTLDAGRFRLPLVSAVRRLAARAMDSVLLLDGPGIVRGVAAAELLAGLTEAAGADLVLALARSGRPLPLPHELAALGVERLVVQAPPAARVPGKRERARVRTRRWDDYLTRAEERDVYLSDVEVIGTPPPVGVAAAWSGRQIALLEGARTLAMGEVVTTDAARLRLRVVPARADVLLVRDARRGEDGLLNTAKPFGATTIHYLPPPDVRPQPRPGSPEGPYPVVRAGAATATLVNGIFGDPLLHVRLHHQRRSLLFDLGEGSRLPARVAHQVSDVFVSHTHIDHIGGFLWLLRSRIGDFPACRLFGPPELAANIAGLVSGIHWDRVGAWGPRFDIAELHGARLRRFRVQAGGGGAEPTGEEEVNAGVIVCEPSFRVRAATLDHRTPVLAFAFEQPRQLNVRKERLLARALAAGPWLTELKRRIAADERDAPIMLPNGEVERTGALADELMLVTPGPKVVYATDLGDTEPNRERLQALAQGAYALFCEATFVEADADKAVRTGHLTARACGEIATAARVDHLVPFHFSRRYEDEPGRVYDEVQAACSRLVMPRAALS